MYSRLYFSNSKDPGELKITYELENGHSILTLNYPRTAKRTILGQLEGYAKTTISSRLISDPRIQPGKGPYRQQLPEYFYEINQSTEGKFILRGTEQALKNAIEALIVGRICTSEHFVYAPSWMYEHAQEIARGNLPATLDYT